MVSVSTLLKVATSQLGYEESGGPSGHDGNITKYWAELDPGFQGCPWCAGFVSWVFKHAGKPLPAIDHSWGYSYCPDAVHWAKAHGLWKPASKAKPGDVVLFCFDGSGNADHTGICEKNLGGSLQTIEGNTEPTNGGNQANGGGVYRKVRPYSCVLGVIDSSRWFGIAAVVKPAKAKPKAPVHNPFHAPTTDLKQGAKGDGVKWIQWAVGFSGSQIDGVFGPTTTAHVKSFQKYHRLAVDGVVGKASRTAMAQVTR